MNRADLFVAGCKAERWRWRSWRATLFSVSQHPTSTKFENYDIDYRSEGTYYYLDGKWVMVTDSKPFEPLYNNRELCSFPADTIPSHPEPIQTTFGRMLFNWMVMHYAFGTKLPFVHRVTPKDIVGMFTSKIVDGDFTPEPGDTDTYFYPNEVSRFVQAMNEVTSICSYISPTGTDKSLTTHPDMIRRRSELIASYNGKKLTQAEITHVQDELVALDKAWLADDDASDFYLGGSAYSVKRKKLFVMHGIEQAFQENGNFDFIETSLSEGADLTKLTAKNNSIREGSFDRGSDTALGGEKVTFMQRIHQTTKVVDGDCGTPLTFPMVVSAENVKRIVGMNMMVGGVVTPINQKVANESIGKVIKLRRPILCKGIGAPYYYCSACTSKALAKTPHAIVSEISAVASNIMDAFMQGMHGTQLALAKYDYRLHIN